jgi:putative transposase
MKKYNSQIHHRKSIRLKEYDYSLAGAYFVTICCHTKKSLFGSIVNEEILLSDFGEIANEEWLKLPERFFNIELNIFQVMPNHIHGIIVLYEPESRVTARVTPTVGNIIGAYKSLVTNKCLKLFKQKSFVGAGLAPALKKPTQNIMGKIWQRNYYEHIIRNEKSYQEIYDYILYNPLNWKEDKYFAGQ